LITQDQNKPTARQSIHDTLDRIARDYTQFTGSEICLELTSTIDHVLLEAGGQLFERVAVFAIGGYGRRELCRHSDIDLFILYDAGDRDSIESRLKDFLHPLWDSRLEIKYSAHTPDEVRRKMEEDSDFATALIESRPLPSHPDLIRQFRRVVGRYFANGNDRFVRMKLEEDRTRRKKYGDTYKLLEPNIKESAGGQRDLHTLQWLVVGKGDREPGITPEEIIGTFDLLQWLLNENYITVREFASLKDAYHFILRIRHGIHSAATSGSAKTDHLDINVRHRLARMLGYVTNEKPDVQAFMQAYYRAAREIDYAHNFLINEHFGHSDSRWWRRRKEENLDKFPGLVRVNNSLISESGRSLPGDPSVLVEVFLYAQKNQLQLTRDARQQIEQSVHTLPETRFQNDVIGRKLCDILTAPDAAEILRALLYTEILVKVIPEIEKIHRLHIQSMYHYYTVDEHTFRTIENLQKAVFLNAGNGQYEFRQVYQELDDPVPLYLGLLLHDIGKAESRDEHHEYGSSMVSDILSRLGLGHYTAIVEFLIQEHLKMERFAFRRDINRIETIEAFGNIAQTEEQLRLLYLLTYADISAVSPELWTEWKATLLHELYWKTRRFLLGEPIQPASAGVPEWSDSFRQLYDVHISQMGPRYAAQFAREEIAEHLRTIQQLSQLRDISQEVRVLVDREATFTEITVITGDRPKLLSTICGVLTSHGLDIMDAGIFTRDEGIALDQFRVVPLIKDQSPQEIGGNIEHTLLRVLREETNVHDLVRKAEQRWRWHRKPLGKVLPAIEWSEENSRVVLEVTGRDRLGLLYYLTKIISEAGFNIHSAKIHTEGQTITDVFYLSPTGEGEVEPEQVKARLEHLRTQLSEFIS